MPENRTQPLPTHPNRTFCTVRKMQEYLDAPLFFAQFPLWMVEIACKMSEIWLFFCFSYFQHFPSIFRVLRREKLYSLLDSWHFRLWMGEITWKMSEKWLAFRFLALSIKFSGFCPRRNLILSSILDILGFGLMKSHEK